MLWLCLYLPCLPHDAHAESSALATLEGIAAWACQYTDRLTLVAREGTAPPFHALLAEIEGSLKLFGGLASLRAQLLQSFAAFGHAHRCAIAPTPAAAEAFALAGDEAPVLRLADLPVRLAPLPLAALDLPPRMLAALRGVGLRSMGECLALPYDQLARRFGAPAVEYLRRLTGQAPDPRPWHALPQGYRRRYELTGAVDSVESLGFVLNRLLLELQGVLIARDNAVLKLALELEHEDHPATTIVLALTAPRRDAPQLLGLLRERLERTAMAPVAALTLRVEEFAANAYGQHDLFDDRVKREAAARELIERLVARLGAAAVQGIALREDHRPELSFAHSCARAALRMSLNERGAGASGPPRPFWLLHEARPLREPPILASPLERIETGWWDGAGVARDYFVAETRAGEKLWVFRERGQWFLHGIWA